jgi:hypothetical protein
MVEMILERIDGDQAAVMRVQSDCTLQGSGTLRSQPTGLRHLPLPRSRRFTASAALNAE